MTCDKDSKHQLKLEQLIEARSEVGFCKLFAFFILRGVEHVGNILVEMEHDHIYIL